MRYGHLPVFNEDAPAAALLIPGRNCQHHAPASHVSVLVDYANYYRAVHESVCKARFSIFVLGWDIDSRIRLLRSTDAKQAECPTGFFDLIRWKAQQNPNLKIYLNRWNYALYLTLERELFARWKWRYGTPPNVHYVADDYLPFGSCHHQKIILIDDEVAFCGGMDIAQCRWDERQHCPLNRHRVDPKGSIRFGWRRFGPYHDVQILVAGPIVASIALLARMRWHQATGKTAISARNVSGKKLPASWPDSFKPAFTNVPVGVALTQPAFQAVGVYQVRQLYLDMIMRAESFIYMENQYFCYEAVAEALHARLKQTPYLRVLLVGSDKPEGRMERKAMWRGRLRFMDIASEGVKDRIALTYPISCVKGTEKAVRIHSKLTIVDDQYLRIGSSNLNRRSQAVDTECDLVLEAKDEATRRGIAQVRSDLIREHTGHELADIEAFIRHDAPLGRLLEDVPHSRQHLRKAQDERYRNERFAHLARWIADPLEPFFHRSKS